MTPFLKHAANRVHEFMCSVWEKEKYVAYLLDHNEPPYPEFPTVSTLNELWVLAVSYDSRLCRANVRLKNLTGPKGHDEKIFINDLDSLLKEAPL